MTGELAAVAVKQDGKVIYKEGRFDPPKPGVLDPANFKDVDYDWYEMNREAHKRMCR